MITPLTRFVIVLLVVAIIILLIYIFIYKYRPPAGITPSPPLTKDEKIINLNENIQTAGIFLNGTNNTLFYRDLNNTYYNVGHCSDCPSGCQNAIEIQPLYDFYSCKDLPIDKKGLCSINDVGRDDRFVSIEVMSAEDRTSDLVKKAGSNKLSTAQCASIL